MSQIATGYCLTSSLMRQLSLPLAKRNYQAFWSLLSDQAAKTSPDYCYSGMVVNVLLTYLEDKGIATPFNDSHPTVRAILAAEISLVLCCDADQAAGYAAAIQQLQPNMNELLSYCQEWFCNDEWPEAGEALREALDYLNNTLWMAPDNGEWILLFIG